MTSNFHILEEYMKDYGLYNFKISSIRDTETYFFNMVKDISNISNHINVFDESNNILTCSINNNSYNFIDRIDKGSYNYIDLYRDQSGNDYIVRRANSQYLYHQFLGFYENIKHILLYLLIKNKMNNVKIVPEPYCIGILHPEMKNPEILFIMEKGNKTLYEYCKDDTTSVDDIKKILLEIYNIYTSFFRVAFLIDLARLAYCSVPMVSS